MVYEYYCPACELQFDVIKSVKEFDADERCEKCKSVAQRQFAPKKLYLSGTKVQEAEYNPGLGCVVKNKQHVKEICRRKGLEEIGNEKPETIHKHFDKAREEKREKAWANADKGWVGNGS